MEVKGVEMSDYKNEAYYRATLFEVEKQKVEFLKNISYRLDCIEEALWAMRESLERLSRVVWNK